MSDAQSTKRCPRCLQEKPISEFSRRNNSKQKLSCYCKPCASALVCAHAKTPKGRERIKRYEKMRTMMGIIAAKRRKFRSSEKGKESRRRENQSLLARHPDRIKVRRALRHAASRGKLEKPKVCSQCGASGRIEGHHHKGYAWEYRFDVLWLCVKCHEIAHAVAV